MMRASFIVNVQPILGSVVHVSHELLVLTFIRNDKHVANPQCEVLSSPYQSTPIIFIQRCNGTTCVAFRTQFNSTQLNIP